MLIVSFIFVYPRNKTKKRDIPTLSETNCRPYNDHNAPADMLVAFVGSKAVPSSSNLETWVHTISQNIQTDHIVSVTILYRDSMQKRV